MRGTHPLAADPQERLSPNPREEGPGCLERCRPVDLRRDFENTCQAHREVHFRWSNGYYEAESRDVRPPVRDSRGPIVGAVGKVQTLLAPEQVIELVNAYESGATTAELSEKFSIHRRTVVLHLHRQGVPLRRGGIAPEHVNEAADLYQSGMSLATIAATPARTPFAGHSSYSTSK